MEITGLAIGVVSLASLFGACLDIIEQVDSYQKYGIESRYITAQLNADTVLFKRWAEATGVADGKTTEAYRSDFEDALVVAAVRRLLVSIYEVFNEANRSSRLGIEDLVSNVNVSESKKLLQVKRADKVAWALGGKKKLVTQVEAFKTLVEKLYNLVPIKDASQRRGSTKLQADIGGLGNGWSVIHRRVSMADLEQMSSVRIPFGLLNRNMD